VVLLIACGNPLRRDDGAGLVLAKRLANRCRRLDMEIYLCHQLTADLASRLTAPDLAAVLFVDSAVCNGEQDFDSPLLRRIPDGRAAPPLGHHLTPEALLALCTTLYGCRPPAWQVIIPGVDFSFGEGLSPLARECLARAEHEVRTFLAETAPQRNG